MAYFGRILRNYADHSFGTITEYGRQLTGIPRAKHAFVVEFYTTKTTGDKPWREMLKGLSTVVQSCDLPSFQFDTQTLNQYNRKRIIQTKVNWTPITIRFYDTRDNKFQIVMEEYFKWYYKDGREVNSNFGSGAFVPDVVDANPSIDKFGFQPPFTGKSRVKESRFKSDVPFGQVGSPPARNPHSDGAPKGDINFEKYFFSKIVISRMSGGREDPVKSPIILFNPTITSIQHDNLDYSSAQPISWSVQFAYEGVQHLDQDKVPAGGPDWISRGADAAGEWYDSWGSQDNTDKSEPTTKKGSNYGQQITEGVQ
tara:strand:- start:5 stop:940 length:936 start_codon:yes stop_codon:yes gene_type:complete